MAIVTRGKFLAAASAFLGVLGAVALLCAPTLADNASPISQLAGRWVGQGRLGFSDGKIENVKCRVTYFVSPKDDEIRQNIRCASPSGNIDVQSNLSVAADKVTGTWTETVYNMHGAVEGAVTKNGFRVVVKGEGLTANMDLILRAERQVVEIQFHGSTLVGLMLVLARG
jgi:hypothetical protein